MDTKYVGEITTLPDNHSDALQHPVFEYDSYYDFTDSLSDYHFDKFADESIDDVVNLNLKFRGKSIDNIMNEVLPYEREKAKALFKNSAKAASLAAWYLNNGIPNMTHAGYKETVKPEKHPTLAKIIDWFEFESGIQPIILEKNIGDWALWHVDSHCGHEDGFRKKKLVRVLIHLQDWEFGQMLQWGTKIITQWRAGDAILFDESIPHATANASRYKRYTLRITGLPSENTLTKIKQGGIINVDEL